VARSRTSTRPVLAGAVGVLAAAALTGCSATNAITSMDAYSASDGVGGTLGTVTAENLLLVAAAADAPGALQGGLTNRGDEGVAVTIALGDDSERVWLPAGETLLLGGSDGDDVVLTTPVAPGAVADVTFSTDEDGEVGVPVPVLDGTLPEYADLVPADGDTGA